MVKTSLKYNPPQQPTAKEKRLGFAHIGDLKLIFNVPNPLAKSMLQVDDNFLHKPQKTGHRHFVFTPYACLNPLFLDWLRRLFRPGSILVAVVVKNLA